MTKGRVSLRWFSLALPKKKKTEDLGKLVSYDIGEKAYTKNYFHGPGCDEGGHGPWIGVKGKDGSFTGFAYDSAFDRHMLHVADVESEEGKKTLAQLTTVDSCPAPPSL